MANIDRDLILYWALDEITESRVADLSGRTNHGRVRGNATVIADAIFGSCLRFTGGGDALALNQMPDFPEREISVCCWVKSTATNEKGTLISYATDEQHNAFTLFDHTDLKVYIGRKYERDTGVASCDGQWRHIAVCWRGSDGGIVIYRDGAEAHRDTLAPGERIRGGGSLMIGQDQDEIGGKTDPAQAFTGEMANLRIYRRMLSAPEVEQIMLADVARVDPANVPGKQAMEAFSAAHPLDFQLLDEDNNNAIYIDNHHEGRNLFLEVTNVGRQSLVLEKQRKVRPAADNRHFELLFRPDTLAKIAIDHLRIDRGRWAMASKKEPDGGLRIFLLSQTGRTIHPGRNLVVELSYVSAASLGGYRATNVELKFDLLHARGEKTVLRGYLSSPLRVIDLRGQINIPLHLGFVGGNTILNLGGGYPNELTLEAANAAMVKSLTFHPEGSEAPTRLILSADAQPPEQRRDWALGTLSEVAAIVPEIDDPRWKKAANEQGETPEWVFTPTEKIQLKPGESLRLTLNNIASSLPPGLANLYLRYEHIPGYRDGQFVLPVEKSTISIKGLPLSGGGAVTWDGPNGRLRWSRRFIALSPGNPNAYGGGYVEIGMPAGDIPAEHAYDKQPRSVTPEGILLKDWEGLYAVHDNGKGANTVSFRIVNHTMPFQTAGNWLLIAAVNSDDRTIKLGTGVTLSAKSSSSGGSPIPVGTIVLWSGQIDRIPDGWALCDGQNGTPDLRDRFIVGAGAGYGVSVTGGANTVALNPNEMPAHNHSASSGAAGDHAHWIEGTDADGLSRRQRRIWGETTVDMGFGGGWNRDPNDERWRGAVNTDNAGTHGHSITVDPAGGSQPHENRPPYYALAFIMKL
ncbi:MAG: LamG-like jellyroll fold domain-containing protein [Blastocatellia bacterium]